LVLLICTVRKGNKLNVTVYNLSCDFVLIYEAESVEEAVRNAYAQYTAGDWNTWGYEKYNFMVVEGKYGVFCGDWAASKHRSQERE